MGNIRYLKHLIKRGSCLAFVFLGACATHPTDAPTVSSLDVTFKRNPGFAGWNCKTEIKVDNTRVAILNMDETLHIGLMPGRHRVDAAANSGTCANFSATYYVQARNTSILQVKVVQE